MARLTAAEKKAQKIALFETNLIISGKDIILQDLQDHFNLINDFLFKVEFEIKSKEKILSWLEEYSSDEIKQAMERVVKEKRSRYKDPEENFERIGLYLRLMRATPEEQQFWILRAGLKKHFYNYQSEWKEMEMILKDLQKQNTFEDIKKFFDDFVQQNRTNDIKDLLSFIKSI